MKLPVAESDAERAREERWAAVLDDLLQSVWSAEALELPDDLGPLPAHLVGTATTVLERQREAMEQLSAQRDEVAAELSSLASIRPSRSATGSTPRSSTLGTNL
jgi:hypothetical protein